MIDPLKLHALADDELSAEESKLLRAELISSEEANRELSAIYNLKDCVRSKAQVFTCEVTLAASMKRVAELDRKRHVDNFVTRYAWGISGAFLALIVVGGVMNRSVSANHVQSAEIASALAWPTRNASQPKSATARRYDQWLDGLLAHAKDSSVPNRMEVRGIVDEDLDGRQVVKVVLRDSKGNLALLVIPGNVTIEGMMDGGSNSGTYITGKINGINCVARNVGPRSLVLFGDRSYDDLSIALAHITPSN